jgi:hypothetical protein
LFGLVMGYEKLGVCREGLGHRMVYSQTRESTESRVIDGRLSLLYAVSRVLVSAGVIQLE